MNIFLVDPNPDICAQALCDLRLNKMLLETAQLLCTAYRHWHDDADAYSDIIYKVTHENHPCSIWLRKDINNYKWLLNYFEALHDERLRRFGKEHLSYAKLADMLYYYSEHAATQYPMPHFDFNCTGIYPGTGNVFTDYKLCLIGKWLADKREPQWTWRGPPNFLMYDLKTERFNIKSCDQFKRTIMQRKILINHPLYKAVL